MNKKKKKAFNRAKLEDRITTLRLVVDDLELQKEFTTEERHDITNQLLGAQELYRKVYGDFYIPDRGKDYDTEC